MPITRNFKLFLNAGHTSPLVIFVNQYDRGEQWVFTLYNNDGTQYVPSTGAIVGIKSDGLGIINTGSVVDGKVVINETEQMTAAPGKAVFELMIDSQTHGTANFIVLVEPKPGDNATLSESDLSLLQEAIDSTSPVVVAENVSEWLEDNITPTTPAVDASLTVAGAAADAKVTGDAIHNLGEVVDVNSLLHDLLTRDDESAITPSSSNWPARVTNGYFSKWNGTFGTGADNYYQQVTSGYWSATTDTGIVNNIELFNDLVEGHVYKLKTFILSGSITKSSSQTANVVLQDIAFAEIGGNEVTFKYNGNDTRLYYHFTPGVAFTNAVLATVIQDVTDSDHVLDPTLNRLSGYKWLQGRHITRGNSVSEPTSVTNTIALLDSIEYNANMYFVLKDGWKVAFVSAENDIVTGIPAYYFETAGKITMKDIYNSLSPSSVNVFGNSLSISIRKSDESALKLKDINIDNALEMHVLPVKQSPFVDSKWVAIGDSITDGRISLLYNGSAITKTNHYSQYGYIASKLIGVNDFVEYGYGGLGYVHVANDGTTYLSDILAMDFGSPDIITVCLGVNDRSQPLGSQSSTANDGTISGSIRNCCEVLGVKYRNSHIVFMTPINACSTGSLETGWSKNAGTTHLADIANMIKYWAGKYGYPVIDLLNESPVNDFNIQYMLLDQLHPTMEAHYMIGHYLAGKLPYKCN